MHSGKAFLRRCPVLFYFLLPLSAQIQLDDLVEVVAEEPVADGALGAPEVKDHSREGSGLKTDRLHFLNRDRLSGDLVGIEVENGLVWRHPDVAKPVRFDLDNLKRVQFKRNAEGGPMDQLARITLTNGDEYRGRVLRMDASTLLLDTPYAGEVPIRTVMIESIRPDSESLRVYEGPNSIEEWVVPEKGDGGWTYKRDALYSNNNNQSVGMNFETFPDLASVEFDLAWRGSPQVNIHFWSETAKNPGQETYSLLMQNFYFRMYHNSRKGGRNDLGHANINQLRSLDEARMKLLLNRNEREVILFINGERVKSWKDEAKGDLDGDAFVLQSTGNFPMKISNIRIRVWDGKLEAGEEGFNETRDLLLLNNGDKFSGTLAKIETGTFSFQTDFAAFDVPVDRVDEVLFGNQTREIPRLRERDTMLHFPSGERITLDLSTLEGGSVTGASEAVGRISVGVDFLEELTLNPYDDRQKDEEDSLW